MSDPIYANLFDLSPNKVQRTQVSIAEAAIHSYVRIGIEGTTYANIADRAGLSRTIVNRYFPEHQDLLLFMSKYIRANYQEFVLVRFTKEKGALNQLRAYLLAAMNWVEAFPDHAHAWLLFFYYCGIKKEFRKLNTVLVKMGFERLRALLIQGQEEGVFKFKETEKTARLLHLTLSGAIMSLMTEENLSVQDLKRDTLDFCLATIGVSPKKK